MHKDACARGVWEDAPQENYLKLGALRLLLRPCLCPNATSLTRIPGGSNTAVRHDARMLSQSISVIVVDLVHVGPDDVGILWTN